MRISDWSSDVCSSDLTRTATEQYAAFGEASYDILPNLTATAGVRLSKANRSVVQVNDGAFLGGFSRAEGDFSERSEEHTSELQSLMRISYAVFCLKKQKKIKTSSTK